MPRLRTRLAVLTVAAAVVLPVTTGAAAAEPTDPGTPPGASPTPHAPVPGAPPGTPADDWTRLLESEAFASTPPVATGRAAVPGETIAWQRCASTSLRIAGARCAVVRVPLDHARPSGPQIRLAVARVRHRVAQKHYRGVMLVNPGGPGGSGRSFAALGGVLPAKVGNAYDWIGFDPRGVGASRPRVQCDPGYFGFDRPDYIPRSRADRNAWLARSRGYAKACADNGEILRHLRTEDVARDMDALRVALGVEKINYYGFSYGTYLGQVYATLFPQRVGRMVLDSNIDPRNVFYRSNLEQDVAIDRSTRLWFRWIADHHRFYQLGTSAKAVQQAYLKTRRTLDRRAAGGRIGGSEWVDIFNAVAYSRDLWPKYALLMSRFVRRGGPGALVRAYRSTGPRQRDNSTAVYLAVQCTDAAWPRGWRKWSRDNWRVYDDAPLTTWMNAWLNMPCRYWPAPAGPRFAVAGDALPRTLLIGGTLDGPTPFANSLAVRRLAPRTALVAIKGEATHAASTNGIPCVEKRVRAYLLSGRLPARNPGNRADVVCPAPPAPRP